MFTLEWQYSGTSPYNSQSFLLLLSYTNNFAIVHLYMWPDLRQAGFHAHNSKTHFSPSNNSCTRWLAIQPGINAESCPGCFCCGLFLRLVRRPRVYGSPSNACISLDKQTAGCNSPHNWLMSLAMDLTALCDMWSWKWHQWILFGWF